MTRRTQFFFPSVLRKVTVRNVIISSLSPLMKETEQLPIATKTRTATFFTLRGERLASSSQFVE